MQYHVFNKKPSRSDIEKAMRYSDPQEQMEALAQSMTPAKGELWQNVNTGRVLVIRSNPMPIQGVPLTAAYVDTYGVVAADVIDRELNVDFDIFFKLRHLLAYKKIGRLKKKMDEV